MSRKSIPNKTNYKPRKIPPPNEEIPCSWPECQRILFSLENLEKHLKAHTEGLHECIYCNRQFSCKSKLKYHVRIHTGEKPFACNHCPKSFSTLGYLKFHTRIHTGEKPYNCQICHRSFAVKFELDKHVGIHTGEKPYNCEICAKSFARSNSLVVHQRIHNGDKPYKCTICSKSFSQHSNCKVHMRIHTGERPCNCQICPKSFAQECNLQSHMRTHKDRIPRARSIGRKCNSSNGNLHMRKVGKSDEQNTPKNCKQRANRKSKDVGRHNEGVSMGGATNRRMQTKYKVQTKQLSSLTCHVCHLKTPSIENLCRHYSFQHNLPKVVMQNLVIQSTKILVS